MLLKTPCVRSITPSLSPTLSAREGICWTLITDKKKDPQWLPVASIHLHPRLSLLPARCVEHQGLWTCSPAALMWCEFHSTSTLTIPPALSVQLQGPRPASTLPPGAAAALVTLQNGSGLCSHPGRTARIRMHPNYVSSCLLCWGVHFKGYLELGPVTVWTHGWSDTYIYFYL